MSKTVNFSFYFVVGLGRLFWFCFFYFPFRFFYILVSLNSSIHTHRMIPANCTENKCDIQSNLKQTLSQTHFIITHTHTYISIQHTHTHSLSFSSCIQSVYSFSSTILKLLFQNVFFLLFLLFFFIFSLQLRPP